MAVAFSDRRRVLGLALLPALAAWGAPAFAQMTPNSSATVMAQLWATFRSKYVRSDGSVADTGNKGITHTEGLGVALLFAQEAGDLKTFELVSAFTKRLERPDGLHSWKWERDKGVADRNNASDGDVYLAWAYLRAAMKWNRADYLAQARKIALALEQHCLVTVQGKRYLMPGVHGFIKAAGGSDFAVLNPSYWVLPAFRELRAVGTDSVWLELHSNARALLNAAPWANSGLPADWIAMRDPVLPWSEREPRFGYEAVRVPLFMAWEGMDTDRSLRAVARFMKPDVFPAWTTLELNGVAPYAAPSGFRAVAGLVRRSVFGTPFKHEALDDDYYSSSLILLSVMAAAHRGWL